MPVDFGERFLGHAYKLPKVRASKKLEWWERDWQPGIFVGFTNYELETFLPGYDVPAWSLFELARPYEPVRIDVDKQHSLGNAFIAYTCYCLDLIAETSVGSKLLSSLAKCGKSVLIVPSYTGGNQYRQDDPAKAQALSSLAVKQPDVDLSDLVKAAAIAAESKKDPLTWLFERVIGSWNHTNYGMLPTSSTSLPEQIEAEDQEAAARAQLAVVSAQPRSLSIEVFGKWLAARKAKSLEEHVEDKHLGAALHEHLRQAVIMALYWTSECNEGASSIVDFAPGLSMGRHDKPKDLQERLLTERPPAIGLAHELIHAYYNAWGMQPDSPNTDVVLTEMACVGLGPWSNPFVKDPGGGEVLSENLLREEWLKEYTLSNFNGSVPDPVNLRVHKQPRKYYAWDEAKHTKPKVSNNEKCLVM